MKNLLYFIVLLCAFSCNTHERHNIIFFTVTGNSIAVTLRALKVWSLMTLHGGRSRFRTTRILKLFPGPILRLTPMPLAAITRVFSLAAPHGRESILRSLIP